MRRENLLTALIVLGLLAGIVVGQALFLSSVRTGMPVGDSWRLAGELILIRPLMLLIMPLVLVSVIVGVTSIGDPSRLGVIGGATFTYYVTTMLMAAVLALQRPLAPSRGWPKWMFHKEK